MYRNSLCLFHSAWILANLTCLMSPARVAATGTGTIVDEDGRPLMALIRFIPQGNLGAGLRDAQSGNDGTLSVPDLPNTAVDVCIHVPGGGYVNPCLWPSSKLILPSGNSTGPLRLVAKKGSIVSVRLNDPSGFLNADPNSPVLVGVFAPGNKTGPVLQDHNGTIWVGTLGAGLCRFDGRWSTVLTKAQGLATNSIYALAEDGNGTLWVGTDAGLNRVRGGRVDQTYTTEQGLPANRIRCLVRDQNGVLWIGTSAGLTTLWDGKLIVPRTPAHYGRAPLQQV